MKPRSRHLLVMSKKAHLIADCKKVKKSLKKMPILKYTRLGWKKHGIHKNGVAWIERSKVIAEREPNPRLFNVDTMQPTLKWYIMPNQARIPEGQRKKQMLHICRSCLTYSGLELWARKCTKKQCRKVMPSVKFWKGMAKTNDIEAFMEELAIPMGGGR